MNAEQVVDKILSQARAEAEAILAEAKSKADAQKAQFKAQLDAFDRQTEAMAHEAGEDKLRRMLAVARMNNAKQTLAAKVELLNKVFQTAQERLVQLPDEAYKALMTKLMVQAVQTGDEEVLVGKNEGRINEDFIKQVNRQLGPGFMGNLRLAQRRADIKGGFILSRGKVQVNASAEVLVEQMRETMDTELTAKLFT